MRRLAWAAGAFSAAIFAANYVLPDSWLLPLAGLFALLGLWLILLRRRWLRAAVILCWAGAIGLLCFSFHAQRCTVPAKKLEGETRSFTAIVLDYPAEYDDYIRADLLLRAEGAPPLRTILYDRSGMLLGAVPGDAVSGEARLRAADTRYGQSYTAYHARDFYLLANNEGPLTVQKEARLPLSSIPARLQHALIERIAEIFPEDTSSFFQALMLGEKGGLYADDALYVAMSRAGIMHIVAVSGVKHLLSGFYRTAKKPVNWALFGHRPRRCTPKLRFT